MMMLLLLVDDLLGNGHEVGLVAMQMVMGHQWWCVGGSRNEGWSEKG